MRRAATYLAALGLAAVAAPARAQVADPGAITLDGSTGNGTPLGWDGTTHTYTIEDVKHGDYSNDGKSLFESFGRFDIPAGYTADFIATGGAPQNVFARVTGGGRSVIAGTLRSSILGPDLVPADFYLLNPSGVTFQEGAHLDVQGSFHVSSAGRIAFGDGSAFTAFASDEPPLLTTEPPAAYGFLPQEIPPEGPASIDFRPLDQPLRVNPGATFDAVGGDIRIGGSNFATFSSPGSRIALVAAGPGVEVPVDLASFDPAAIPAATPLGAIDVVLASTIRLSEPQTESGSLLVRGGSFSLANGSSIIAVNGRPLDSRHATAIDIAVRDALRIDGSLIQVGTTGLPDDTLEGAHARGGDLRLSGGSIEISDSDLIAATTRGGDAPQLFVRGDSLGLSDGAQLFSRNNGSAAGGAIDIDVGELSLSSGGRIVSQATSTGAGGPLRIVASRIDASDTPSAASGSVIESETTRPSADPPGGDAGRIDINADQRISLRDGAQIFSRTSGSGSAGRVEVRAPEIDIEGIALDASQQVQNASIETRALRGSTGNAGELLPDGTVQGLSIEADFLRVANGGRLSTSTQGAGAAGDLRLAVRDAIELDGGPIGPSEVVTAALPPADAGGDPVTGEAGRVLITTDRLTVRGGSEISSSTEGSGDAGVVDVSAGSVELSGTDALGNPSGIFAKSLASELSNAGAAGGVNITSSEDVELRDGAAIGVETHTNRPAGNVSIDAGGRLLLDAATISAEAMPFSSAPGGSIQIAADRGVVLGHGSLIQARSRGTGPAGRVAIDAGTKLEMTDSSISTESITEDNPGGGQILVSADDQILLDGSSINTSVAAGGGDGGDIHIDPQLMLLNGSQIRADAFDGNGGRVFIRADTFVISADSEITAKSRGPGDGVDGEVVIDSPEAQVSAERAEPAARYLDVAGLLRTSCGAAASQAGSFVVTTVAGLPASPEGPLPAPLWDALAQAPATRSGAAPGLASPALHSLRVAALAGGCEAQEEL